MEPLSIVCVLIGVLVILSRAPLIFAPISTLDFFDELISSDAKLRVVGFVVGGPALGLIAFAFSNGGGGGDAAGPGEQSALHGLLYAFGWLLAGVTLLLLVAPRLYRRLAEPILKEFRTSIDTAFIRVLGAVGVSIGGALVYAGLFAL